MIKQNNLCSAHSLLCFIVYCKLKNKPEQRMNPSFSCPFYSNLFLSEHSLHGYRAHTSAINSVSNHFLFPASSACSQPIHAQYKKTPLPFNYTASTNMTSI